MPETVHVIPPNSKYVLDGGSLLHKVTSTIGDTFAQICRAYVKYIKKRYGNCPTIVFDRGYDATSNKDAVPVRRAKGRIGKKLRLHLNNQLSMSKSNDVVLVSSLIILNIFHTLFHIFHTIQKTCHPSIYFNNKSVKKFLSQEHLGLILYNKLNFQEHLQKILNKVNKTIGLLRKLQNILPREPLLTIYKSFVRPHFDYGDVIYDQHYNNSFHQKLESIQYNAALAVTGALRDSFRETLYQELGLESLKQRRWFRKLCYFFKVTKNQSPKYLFDKIPTTRTAYRTRNNIGNIPRFNVKHNYFKNSFSPFSVTEWNNKCLLVNKLAQITPKLTHPVVLQLPICLFCNGVLSGIPGTFRYISTWLL